MLFRLLPRPFQPDRTVREYLIAFALALIAPTLILLVIVGWQFSRAEQRQVEQDIQTAADLIAAKVDVELARMLTTAQSLASSAALRSGNFDRFHSRATEMLQTFSRANDYAVVVRDQHGQQLVNTRLPRGERLPRANLELDREVLTTKQPYVADLFVGGVTNEPLLSVRVPVLSQDVVEQVLAIGFRPAALAEVLKRHPVPARWHAIVVDRRARIVAHSHDWQQVGQSAPAIADGSPVALQTLGARSVLAGAATSRLSGWQARVIAPADALGAPFARALEVTAQIAVVLLGGSLLLARRFAVSITGPLRSLRQSAEALGEGRQVEPMATGLREADRVSNAMWRASGELERREAALRGAAELQKNALELRAAKDVAEQASAAKSQFLATMSHEIRTPLTTVLGAADLLSAEDLTPRQRRYVDAMRTAGRHLLALINDILDISRIEAGRLELEHIDFRIAEVLESVRSLMAPQAVERGLELRIDIGEPVPALARGDPTRLSQVLVNLIGNALKFTAQGRITVAVSIAPSLEAEVPLRFVVEDTGIGIPDDIRTELFLAFVQADASMARRYGGSGLGLAITKQLIEAMRGTVGVDSTPGHGSRFWFDLPLRKGDPRLVSQHDTSVASAVAPRRVLLAEDVALNRDLITEMLSRHGHQVVIAINGVEAVEQASAQDFDLILMDVQMPVMDGVEATRRIRRAQEGRGSTPIIGLTANVLATERERYLAAGMDECLTKPINWGELFGLMLKLGSGDRHAPSLAAEAQAPIIESTTLMRLQATIPPQELTGLLGRALIDAEQTVERLEQSNDPTAIAKEAHSLRGTSALFGLHRVGLIAGEIETAARADDDVGQLIAQLRAAVCETRDALRQYVREP